MDFYDVADAGESVDFRGDMEMAEDGAAGTVLVGTFVGFLVEELALCGEAVLRPCLLVVDKGVLARAVEEMLEGGEGDELCFGGHLESWFEEISLFPSSVRR